MDQGGNVKPRVEGGIEEVSEIGLDATGNGREELPDVKNAWHL